MDGVGLMGRAYGRTRVVAIGDSVTYGQHVSPEKRWTTVLADLKDMQVINKGVCGDTTRGGLERFPQDVQNLNPNIVLIQFGFNDCNHWHTDNGLPRVSLDAFKANLKEMVERVNRLGAKPVLLSMYMADKGHDYRRWQTPYLAAIDSLRRDLWHGSFNLFHNQHIDTIDGLHPSETGHRRYAELVAALL